MEDLIKHSFFGLIFQSFLIHYIYKGILWCKSLLQIVEGNLQTNVTFGGHFVSSFLCALFSL